MDGRTDMPEGNVVPFPAPKHRRRKPARDSDDPRVRTVALLRRVFGWLLATGLVLFLLANYRMLSLSSLRGLAGYAMAGLRQHEGDITTIQYQNDIFADGVLFDNGLAYADSDALYLAKPGGAVTLSLPLGYSAPVVETAGSYVLVYDRGGTRALLANASEAVAELSLASPIITGHAGKNGGFVLVTDEQGFRTSAAVYDARGTEVFKFNSSEYYIVSAALTADGKGLAVLAFQQQGAEVQSHVLFYSVATGELLGDAAIPGALGMELCSLSGDTAAVLCDDGLYLAGRGSGGAERLLTIASSDLLAFTVQENGLALATRSYSGSARSDLYILRADGVLGGPYALPGEATALALSDTGAAVLSASGVYVYGADGAPRWHNSEAAGARRVLLAGNGTVYAMYAKHIRLFTARSARSEDIPDAG